MRTPLEIARIEEASAARFTADLADVAEEIAGGFMCFSGVGSWTNQAANMGLDGPVTEAEIDRFVEFYVSRGVEPKIVVSPFVDEALLGELAKRGFALQVFENVLAREIDPNEDLRAVLSHGWPVSENGEPLRVRPVDAGSDVDVRTYAEIMMSGFVPPNAPLPESELDLIGRNVRHEKCACFLATFAAPDAKEPQFVASTGMAVDPPSAHMYGTTVLEPWRRRGIQQAMIVHRLQVAQRRGCTLACIVSKPGIPTERNAMRLGFRMAYSKANLSMPGEGLTPSP